jgi:nitroreductase
MIMNTFTSQLDWRFATKKFDPTKKVSEQDLNKILTAIQKAPSSFGIQPYHIFVVTDPEVRKAMRAASWDQPQVTDSSHIFVFCSRTDLKERVDAYLEVASGGSAEIKEKMKGYADMMHGSLDNRTEEAKQNWSGRQAYIALGFGLASCAELNIDACPMEGFDNAAVNKILNLPENMNSLAYMAIGYRAEEPTMPKVRFPQTDLFTMK